MNYLLIAEYIKTKVREIVLAVGIKIRGLLGKY